jgi:hypothetical protein
MQLKTQPQSLKDLFGSCFDIYLNDDLSPHNEDKDGDQNDDSPCDQSMKMSELSILMLN